MAELRTPKRRSPLGHRSAIEGEGGAVRLTERPFLGKFILRAAPDDAVGRLRQALGFGLPFDALTSSTAGDTAWLWMGPDEWMLVTPPGDALERFSEARTALAGLHHQLVDVSAYYTAVDISGSRARELLMKLTTLDLHARAFRTGMVTGALFGRANATIWQIVDDAEEGGPSFHLFIRWSMADYLWCALAEAGREWGLPAQTPIKGERLTVA